MTLRIVTPASGAAQLRISYTCGEDVLSGPEVDTLLAGQVLDVIPSSALENAIGLGNLTALSGTLLTNAQTGSDGSATGNC